jgi:DNA-binding MarR family transcriptional regulator
MSQENGRSALIHQAIDLMIRTSRLHHRNIEKLFDDTGLHRSQRRMLMHLSRFETMPSQRKIADDFDISPACVARTLKSLALEGYITRTGDEDDLRRNTVSITEKGLQTVSETHQTFERVDDAAFENMTAEEIEQLISLLGRVQDNLRRLEEGDNNMKGSASN